MTIPDEMLIAYADGELDADRRLLVEAALAADPALADRLDAHRALRDTVHNAYAGALDEPPPQALIDIIARGAPTDRMSARRGLHLGWLSGGAVAASLMVGVLIGQRMLQAGDLLLTDQGLTARGELAETLTHGLAADNGKSVRVQITFRDEQGRYCRTFSMQGEKPLAGIACRDAGDWRIEVAQEIPVTLETTGYRTASSALPEGLAAVLDRKIQGEPLDATAEAAAVNSRWGESRDAN